MNTGWISEDRFQERSKGNARDTAHLAPASLASWTLPPPPQLQKASCCLLPCPLVSIHTVARPRGSVLQSGYAHWAQGSQQG